MGDAGQQRAERGELLALIQGFALSRELARGPLPFGDVARDRQHVRLALIVHRDAVHFELQRGAVLAQFRDVPVQRLAGGDRPEQIGVIRRPLPRVRPRRRGRAGAMAVHPAQRRIGVHEGAFGIPQRQPVDRGVEHRVILLLARAERRLGQLAVGDVASEREDAILPADGDALAEHVVPAQAAVLAPAVPFDAQLLARGGASEQVHRILPRVGPRARAEPADVDRAKLLAAVAERGAGPGIGIDDGAGLDVVHEDGILGRVEDRPVARFRDPQCLGRAPALVDVLAQPGLRVGDLERHRVEGAAQPPELVAPLETAAGGEIPRREPFGRVHQPRRAPRQKKMKHQPHAQRERRHPAGPVERLLDNLRACFRLVALQIVGEIHAAGARRTQLLALAAHQDAGMAEQLAAVRDDGHSRAPFATPRPLIEIELRQHLGRLAPEPRTSCRGDHLVAIVRQRGEREIVVVREHRDLVLRAGEIALEEQILECALQARHLLREPLAAVLLRRALGLRHVIDQVDGAQRRGESQQNERDRELERGRHADGHWTLPGDGPGVLTSACPRAAPARARSRSRSRCAAASPPPSAP